MSAVTLWCLLICFWSYGVKAQNVNPCIDDWEIGTPQSVECSTKNLTTGQITLQLESNSGFVDVSSCKIPNRCTDFKFPVYTSYLGRRNIEGDEVILMSVHINGVRREENTFRCVYDDILTDAGCFEMFVRPPKPVCEPPTLVNLNTQLNITCTSDRVYPGAYLGIILAQDGTKQFPDSYEVEFDSKLSLSLTYPGYGVTTHTALITVSSLEPNTYQFIIRMLPVISNETLASERGSESTIVTGVVLTVPEVSLSAECLVDGYVASDMCKCELSTPGYPPGQARWYTESGQVVGTENLVDRSSTLRFSPDSEESVYFYLNVTKDPSASYECRAETLLNVSSTPTVFLAPKFPSGPNSVIIESSVVGGIFDLCPSEEHIMVEVICKVPTQDVKPSVTFTILVNNDIMVDQEDGAKVDSDYYYHYSFRPSKGGSYSVDCKAKNTISPQILQSKKLTFEVRVPPPSRPVFHVPRNQPGSHIANVVLGETIDITCKVDGGQPQVSEVTITCGSRKEQVQGKIAALTLEVIQSLDGQICYCSAKHDSGCYKEEDEVVLEIVSKEAFEDGQASDDNLLIIVLPIVGAVVLIAIVAVIIIIYMRKRRRNPAPPKNNTAGNHTVPSVTDQVRYITPRAPVSGDYAQMIINDDLASNGHWNYNNPAFRASPEYDRISDVFTPTACNTKN